MNDITQRGVSTGTVEIRDFELEDFEFRADGEDSITFEGVASLVDTPYMVRDAFGEYEETIARGAFNKTIKDGSADVALFVNHNVKAIPLATRLDGSLQLRANPHLAVTAVLNAKRHDVQDTRIAVEDRQLRQMSIGFSVPKDRQTWNDDYTKRSIREVNLVETSIVWRGMSTKTTAAIRSIDQLIAELPADLASDEIRRAITYLETLLSEEKRATVMKSDQCPVDKPWALMDDGELMSCHVSEAEAMQAMEMMRTAIHPDLVLAIADAAKKSRPEISFY